MGRPKPEEPRATWTVRLPVSFANTVDAMAESTGHNRSDFIRAALERAVEFNRAQPIATEATPDGD